MWFIIGYIAGGISGIILMALVVAGKEEREVIIK